MLLKDSRSHSLSQPYLNLSSIIVRNNIVIVYSIILKDLVQKFRITKIRNSNNNNNENKILSKFKTFHKLESTAQSQKHMLGHGISQNVLMLINLTTSFLRHYSSRTSIALFSYKCIQANNLTQSFV